MGYRIVYGEAPFFEKPAPRSHLRILTAGFALAFVLLVRCCWPQGTALLREVLIPGEDPAFALLVEQIEAGEPVGDAVTTFCRSIVEEAVAQAD